MAKYTAGSLTIDPLNTKVSEPQGRLTLTTLVPVLISTVATSATVRYTPYTGNKIPIWNGSSFEMRTFSELVNTLADSTDNPAAGAAGKNYDLFVGYKNGNLILVRDVAWTNDTTPVGSSTNPRAGLNRVQGILVNENAITNGPAIGYGTYVGTIRTDAGGATVSFSLGGSSTPAVIGFFNAYNRIDVKTFSRDGTASWTYSANTVRQVNASANNQCSFVRGLNEDGIQVIHKALVSLAVAGAIFNLLVGLDSTTSGASSTIGQWLNPVSVAGRTSPMATYNGLPGLGFHYLAALEQGDGTNTATIFNSQEFSVAMKA